MWNRYDAIWYVIKDKLDMEFRSKPVYENKYLKSKVREFDGTIKTKFWGNDIPQENIHCLHNY